MSAIIRISTGPAFGGVRIFSTFVFLFGLFFTSVSVSAADVSKAAADPWSRPGLLFKGPAGVGYRRAPDVATDVRVEIGGVVGSVQVTQYFSNPDTDWKEGIYVFPLPENAAIHRLKLRVGKRTITGKIKKRAAAKKIYRDAAKAGQRAGLVEQERPNIFTVSVANIGPGEVVAVELHYVETIRYDQGAFRFRMPMVVAPRFVDDAKLAATVGGEPSTNRDLDADRITPPMRHPDQGIGNPLGMTIKLTPGFAITDIKSTYHAVQTHETAPSIYTVTLDGDAVPANRDFELTWRPAATDVPVAASFIEHRDDGDYLLAVIAPAANSAVKSKRLPRDVVFVIDVSGSMKGTSIHQAKSALTTALDRLTPKDAFNIIVFSSQAQALHTEPVRATRKAINDAKAAVAALRADGGTRMLPALELALEGRPAEGRLRQIVVMTDGAIRNERQIFRLLPEAAAGTRIFTIGIGSAPNGHLMQEMANMGRGSFTYIGALEEVDDKMTGLFAKLENPLMTNISVRPPDSESTEMLPRAIPDLYAGEPVVIAARLAKAYGKLSISGQRVGSPWKATLDLDAAKSAVGVAKIWARRKVRLLLASVHLGADSHAVECQVTDIALEHHLISPFTSLVVIDPKKARPDGKQLNTGAVATNLPQGWVWPEPGKPGPVGMPIPQPSAAMHAPMAPGYGGGAAKRSYDTSPGGGIAGPMIQGMRSASGMVVPQALPSKTRSKSRLKTPPKPQKPVSLPCD